MISENVVRKFSRKYQLTLDEALLVYADLEDILHHEFLGEAPVLTSIVEAAWQNFILYSVDYKEYCNARFGKTIPYNPTQIDSCFWVSAPESQAGLNVISAKCNGDDEEGCGGHCDSRITKDIARQHTSEDVTDGIISAMTLNYMEVRNVSSQYASSVFDRVACFLEDVTKVDSDVSPEPDVDDAWHYFMLHTEKYMTYCQQKLGVFVHHIPYTLSDITNNQDMVDCSAGGDCGGNACDPGVMPEQEFESMLQTTVYN